MNLVIQNKPNGRSYQYKGHLTDGWKLKDLDSGGTWDSIEDYEAFEKKKDKQVQMAKARAARKTKKQE